MIAGTRRTRLWTTGLATLAVLFGGPSRPAAAQRGGGDTIWILSAALRQHQPLDPTVARVGLDVENVTLDHALMRLVHGGAPLVYTMDLVADVRSVTCRCTGLTLTAALDLLLQGTGIGYRTLPATSQILLLRAQPATRADAAGAIRGRVLRRDDGSGITGASVVIAGSSRGVLTDEAGNYLLSNVPAGQHWVQAQALGFRADSQVVVVRDGESTVVDFRLEVDPVALNPLEVDVLTGTLVATEKRALAHSIAVISEEDLGASGATSLIEVLTARVPGVAALQTSGANGAGNHIQIRGVSSFLQDQAPLIYVDGVPVDAGSSARNARGLQNSGFAADQGAHVRLGDLTIHDIQRIEVIKGPAATTMYGTEASNGVIQIFTKRGVPGEQRFTMSMEQGFSRIRLADSFVEHSPFAGEMRSLFKNPQTQRYTASLRGGAGTLSYSFDFAHDRDAGVTVGNDEQITTAGASFGTVAGADFSLRVSGNFVQRRYRTRDYRPLFEFADTRTGEYNNSRYFEFESVGQALQEARRSENSARRFYGSVDLMWRPTEVWQNRVTVGLDQSFEEDERVGPVPAWQGEGYLRDRVTRDFDRISGRVVSTVSYPNTGPITSTLSFGGEAYRDEVLRLRLQGLGLPSTEVTGFDYAEEFGGGDRSMPTELYSAIATVGLFAQEQVAFHDRFFLTAGLRADGSSAFGDDFGIQWYPNVGASYVLQPTGWWNAKLRAAWGRSGKAPEPFAKALTFEFYRDFSTGTPAQRLDNAGNEGVKPEVGTEIEVGIENYFWGNRASVELNYFHQETQDAILRAPISPVSGFFRGPEANLGSLRSQGVELVGQITPLRTAATSLTLGVTLTHMIENGVITGIGAYDFLSFANQTANWRILEGLSVGSSLRDLIFHSAFEFSGNEYGDFISAGSRVATTYGGMSADFRFLDRIRLYANTSFGFGGHAFDYVRANRDAVAGLLGSINALDPEVALERYVVSTDYARLNTLRAVYQVPPRLVGGMGEEVEVWLEGRNLYTWDRFDNGDPTSVAVEGTYSGYIHGTAGYVVPTPQRYVAGVRVTF